MDCDGYEEATRLSAAMQALLNTNSILVTMCDSILRIRKIPKMALDEYDQ